MITDPWFYVVAVPAVLLFGISKGGFGGGLGVVAVPLMALVISPVQAAAILLPILCLMDLVSAWAYRGKWDWYELRIMVPASLIGIAAGTLLFGAVGPRMRLVVPIFTLNFLINQLEQAKAAARRIGEILDLHPCLGDRPGSWPGIPPQVGPCCSLATLPPPSST